MCGIWVGSFTHKTKDVRQNDKTTYTPFYCHDEKTYQWVGICGRNYEKRDFTYIYSLGFSIPPCLGLENG